MFVRIDIVNFQLIMTSCPRPSVHVIYVVHLIILVNYLMELHRDLNLILNSIEILVISDGCSYK